MAHDAVARLVVDLAGRALDRVEDDVLVEPGDHPVGQLAGGRGCTGSSCSRAAAFFQATISSQPLGLHEPERGGELAHAEVQPGDGVVGLAVVAERARVRRAAPGRARRASRPRRSRPSWSRRTTTRRRRPTCPGRRPFQCGAVRVRAVLDQEDPLARGTARRSRSTSNAMCPPMWTRIAARGRWRVDLRLEVGERHAEVVAVAVDERDAGARVQRGQRRGHERVRRAQHGLAAHARELERGQRGAGPAGERDRAEAVPGRPRGLEAPRSSAPPTSAGSR